MSVRIIRNLTSGAYQTIASVAGQLFLVPLFVSSWGSETYGSWLVLSAVPSYFIFAELGLSTATANAVSIAWVSKRCSLANRIYASVWWYQSAVWAILFALLIVVACMTPAKSWLAIANVTQDAFVLVVALLAINAFLALQAGLLQTPYRAAGKFDKMQWLNGHFRVVESVLVGVMLASSFGMVSIALCMVLVRAANIAWLWSRALIVLPLLRTQWRDASFREFLKLLPSGIAFTAYPVVQALSNQGASIVLNQMLGPSSVVLLNVGRQVARCFQMVVSVLLRSVEPEMTLAYGRADRKFMRSTQKRLARMIAIAAVPFVVGCAVYGETVVRLWLGKGIEISSTLLVACVFEAVAASLGGALALVPYCANRHHGISVVYTVVTILGMVAAYFMVPHLGVDAFPLSLGCALAFYSYWSWEASRQVLEGELHGRQ